MEVSEDFTDSKEVLKFGSTNIDGKENWWVKEIEAPEDFYFLTIKRTISKNDIINNKKVLEKMPGFRVSWHYNSKSLDEYLRFGNTRTSQEFRR